MWLRSRSSFALHYASHEHHQSLGLNKLHEYDCKSECSIHYNFESFFKSIWNSDTSAHTGSPNADQHSDSRL